MDGNLTATGLQPGFSIPILRFIGPSMVDAIMNRIIKEVKEKLYDTQESGSKGKSEQGESRGELLGRAGKPYAHWAHPYTPYRAQQWSRSSTQGCRAECTRRPWTIASCACSWVVYEGNFKGFMATCCSLALNTVFSVGWNILKLNGSILTSGNFEIFVFLKGNMHLLQLELAEVKEETLVYRVESSKESQDELSCVLVVFFYRSPSPHAALSKTEWPEITLLVAWRDAGGRGQDHLLLSRWVRLSGLRMAILYVLQLL